MAIIKTHISKYRIANKKTIGGGEQPKTKLKRTSSGHNIQVSKKKLKTPSGKHVSVYYTSNGTPFFKNTRGSIYSNHRVKKAVRNAGIMASLTQQKTTPTKQISFATVKEAVNAVLGKQNKKPTNQSSPGTNANMSLKEPLYVDFNPRKEEEKREGLYVNTTGWKFSDPKSNEGKAILKAQSNKNTQV